MAIDNYFWQTFGTVRESTDELIWETLLCCVERLGPCTAELPREAERCCSPAPLWALEPKASWVEWTYMWRDLCVRDQKALGFWAGGWYSDWPALQGSNCTCWQSNTGAECYPCTAEDWKADSVMWMQLEEFFGNLLFVSSGLISWSCCVWASTHKCTTVKWKRNYAVCSVRRNSSAGPGN